MRKTIIYYIAAAVALLNLACDSVDEPPVETPPLVIEGWIEEGENPVVTVARAILLAEEDTLSDDYVEKWARVSIYDGENRYLLTGKIDRNYTLQFVYTSSRLRGQMGHTYRLVVETERDTVEAVTTMQPAVSIESITPQRVESSTSDEYLLNLKLKGVVAEGRYKVFTKVVDRDKVFHGSFLGTFTGADYDPEIGINVSSGVNSTYDEEEFTHYFKSGETVYVKVCSLDEPAYRFWKAYDSAVSMSGNLLFTFSKNCPTNVAGGLGYFAAYGTSFRIVRIPIRCALSPGGKNRRSLFGASFSTGQGGRGARGGCVRS